MPSDGKSSPCLWQGELIRFLLSIENVLIRTNNKYVVLTDMYVLALLNPIFNRTEMSNCF
jgi:hypothetical protein